MKKLLTCLLLISCLCGCSKPDREALSGNFSTLRIPLDKDIALELNIPSEFILEATDNAVYWRYKDDVLIYVSKVTLDNKEFDDKTKTYLNSKATSIEFVELDKEITIMAPKKYLKTLAHYLGSSNIVNVDTNLYVEKEISVLPEYADKSEDMKLSEHNLYVPLGAEDSYTDIYSAELLCSGNDWIESYILDGNLEDISDYLVNVCISNNSEYTNVITSWYQDDSILYVECGDHVVSAKKLRENEWYVYTGSLLYKDYILTGLHKVKSDA